MSVRAAGNFAETAVSLKVTRPAVEAEPVNATAAVADLQDDVIRCHACQLDLSSNIDAATSTAPVLVNAPQAARWTSAPGFAIAVLVLAIGVGFLIPILCSVLAIGVGVVALWSSSGKGTAVKRLAVASVLLGIVGVIGAIAVLSGA